MTVTPELESIAKASYAIRAKGGAPKLSRWARWDELDPASQEREIEAMRAALLAIRTPTPDMILAAADSPLSIGRLWLKVIDYIRGEATS